MSFDYADLRETARELLEEFGQSMTFSRKSASVYDNETNTFPSTPVTFTDKGVIFPFGKGVSNVNGSIIQTGDQEVFWQGSTEPKPTDNLTVNGVDYNVIAVMPIEPAGVNVLYQIQVRR